MQQRSEKSVLGFVLISIAIIAGAAKAASQSTATDIFPSQAVTDTPEQAPKLTMEFCGDLSPFTCELWKDEVSMGLAGEASDRTPASAKKAKQKKTRSRFPSSVSDGFEFRVRYAGRTSVFWVVRRGDRHDLLFANSAGTKSSRSLASENFNYLHSTALEVPKASDSISKCPMEAAKLNVVSAGQTTRSVAVCLNGKTKSVEQIKGLGNLLSAMVY